MPPAAVVVGGVASIAAAVGAVVGVVAAVVVGVVAAVGVAAPVDDNNLFIFRSHQTLSKRAS